MRKRCGGAAATLSAALLMTGTAVSWTAGTAAAITSPGNTHFPRYKELESNVAFWGQVFEKWTSRQIAFHDVEHLDLVYSVLSIDDIVTRLPRGQQDDAIRARRKAEGERISAMLNRIADGHARTEEERRILKSIARIGHEPEYARTLADQVRSQRGLGDKFCEAMDRARSYKPMMTRVLREQGVPEELMALPLVESGYQIGARSSVGAAGIWQFMPATAKLFMDTGTGFDDRRDPLRATEAAAKMLRKSYESLGSWPLAITSYNHGPGGVATAVKEMGTTHFGVIARHYKGKTFGFASRNFYAEFLAAHDALAKADQTCGPYVGAVYSPDEVALGASASIRDLARAAGTSADALADLNPGLNDNVASGTAKVPKGYRLNLPKGSRNDFEVAFGHVDRSSPSAPTIVAKADVATRAPETASSSSSGNRKVITHKVTRGQTLSQIARRYGTSETALLSMNGLRSAKSLQAGQNLKVPGGPVITEVKPTVVASAPIEEESAPVAAAAEAASLAARTAVAAVPAAVIQKEVPEEEASEPVLTSTHKVGRGQTLSQISAMYRMPVEDLKRMNGIRDAASIQAGQTLKVRASGSEIASSSTVGRTYKVKSGDTLSSLAKANNTSVETLKRLNPKVSASGLKAGEAIKVPSGGATSVASAAPAKSKSTAKASSKSTYRSHRVTKGQTLSAIAAKYRTSVDTLKRINGIRDARNVQVGQTLKVPL